MSCFELAFKGFDFLMFYIYRRSPNRRVVSKFHEASRGYFRGRMDCEKKCHSSSAAVVMITAPKHRSRKVHGSGQGAGQPTPTAYCPCPRPKARSSNRLRCQWVSVDTVCTLDSASALREAQLHPKISPLLIFSPPETCTNGHLCGQDDTSHLGASDI